MNRVTWFLLLPLCLILQACGSDLAPQNSIVFTGDSITAYWGEQEAFQAHANWIDKGISGQTSYSIAMRFQRDVLDLHPAVVHILAGTNDVYPGWVLCNTEDPQDTCLNIENMVEAAKQHGIRVVLGTIPPWGCADDPECGASAVDKTPERYDRIAQLNAWLKTFAAQEGVTLIDYHAALTNAEGLHYAEGLTIDGIHPSSAGYEVMQPLVEAALQ